VVAYLGRLGWRVVARNLRLGRDEIDVLAVDPGPPPQLVAVEVRSLRAASFGAPEERVDHAKVAHMYRALSAAARDSDLAVEVSRLAGRVDLVVVDRRSGRTQLRHLRALEPP
jgi:Holliday junction resolvase-like predicted endonuclease